MGEPICARMTFIFRKNASNQMELFELHSSVLPPLDEKKFDETSLKEAFDAIDINGNGVIEVCELSALAGGMGLAVDDSKLDIVLKKIDKDRSGRINFDEFKSAMAKMAQ